MCFQVFCKQKGTRVLQWQEDSSFIYKTMFQFFEILSFSQDIWGNIHYVPEINLIS